MNRRVWVQSRILVAIAIGASDSTGVYGDQSLANVARVSVAACDRPLAEIAVGIARELGAAVTVDEPADSRVSVTFDGELLPSALERIVGPRSFTVVVDREGRVRGVHIFRVPGATTTAPSGQQMSVVAPTSRDNLAVVSIRTALLGGQDPAAGILVWREKVRTSPAALAEAQDTLEKESDPEIRAAVLDEIENLPAFPKEMFLRIAESDPNWEQRASAIDALLSHAADDPGVQAVIDRVATSDPEGAVRALAESRARTSSIASPREGSGQRRSP